MYPLYRESESCNIEAIGTTNAQHTDWRIRYHIRPAYRFPRTGINLPRYFWGTQKWLFACCLQLYVCDPCSHGSVRNIFEHANNLEYLITHTLHGVVPPQCHLHCAKASYKSLVSWRDTNPVSYENSRIPHCPCGHWGYCCLYYKTIYRIIIWYFYSLLQHLFFWLMYECWWYVTLVD